MRTADPNATTRSSLVFLMSALTVLLLFSCTVPAAEKNTLLFSESNSAAPLNESMLYNRFITWRPADGLTVGLNPPRFSWPYEPGIFPENIREGSSRLPLRRYRFQISQVPDFGQTLVDVLDTEFNFYNTLSPLPAGKTLYWRVGYYGTGDTDREELRWQKVRKFNLAEDAVAWDRSGLEKPRFVSKEHPRIIFTADRLDALRALHKTDPHARAIYEQTVAAAKEDLKADWFLDFPKTDTLANEKLLQLYPDLAAQVGANGGSLLYLRLVNRLIKMAFAYMITADEDFLAVIEPFLTVAAYPPGGHSSPEGIGGNEDYVALNEFLALFYDWFYHEMSPDQRNKILACLHWRVDHIVNNYSWRTNHGKAMKASSIAVAGSSHPYENINYTYVAGLAAYEEDQLFRTTYELGAHYLTGVSSPFGPEDSWNEGPGYGLSKFKWMMFATCYYELSLRGAEMGLNPFLTEIGEFFTRVAVLGLPHLSFGNIGLSEPYYLGNKLSSFRKLAYLTGNRRFLKTWEDASRRMEQIGYMQGQTYHRPWIEYALPLCLPEPEKEPQVALSKLFPDGGWVTASSRWPGELDNYAQSVGITFRARPRGAFNHAFFSDNGFQLYAYGQNITHAGGSTQNGDRHAHHSMSHNIVLVDGLGQAQPAHTRWANYSKKELYAPYFARIARYADRDGAVYFKGEAAKAYIQYPYVYREFWGRLGDEVTDPYGTSDLSYLTLADRHVLFVDNRYFVMLDDLAVDPDKKPSGSRFSWLYHVLQDVPLEWDEAESSFSYTLDDVTTVVKVIASEDTDFQDRLAGDGLINPITGEDYNPWVKEITRYDRNYSGPYPDKVTHNIWITNSEPARKIRFLTVIFPYRATGDQQQERPRIESLDNLTVRVSQGEKSEIVTFDPSRHPEADIQVEF